MPKKQLTFTSKLLISLAILGDLRQTLLPTPQEFKRKAYYGFNNYDSFRSTIYYLNRKGLIKFVDKNAKRFIKITKNGQLEALLSKAILPQKTDWDGRWRLIVFDIPEEARDKRDKLRWLLKINNFEKLQASVFISPYALNRDAIAYLKKTGLIEYIRILKIEEMDDDRLLRKKFKLN